MEFDFDAILALLTAVSGAIWLGYALLASRHPLPGELAVSHAGVAGGRAHGQRRLPLVVDYAKSFFPVLLAVFLLRGFLLEPYKIPSGSMMPTLLVGDFILVSKSAYGVRLPVGHVRLFGTGAPKRGDVMVFKSPQDPGTTLIKRVIGVPGDAIRYDHRVVYVNGAPYAQKPIAGATGRYSTVEMFSEDIGGRTHRILHGEQMAPLSETRSWTVPAGHYFTMGDNRDNSADGRVYGMVPDSDIVGKAVVVWMHWGPRSALPGFSSDRAIE